MNQVFPGHTAMPSFCTAAKPVLRALLRDAGLKHRPILLEATANQVDQFGGYTGMKPQDYTDSIFLLAHEVDCDPSLILLGGDHLGPLTFAKRDEAEAMALAKDLVASYVKAGFTKIHLDTSMKVADDGEGLLDDATIARRGAELCLIAEKAAAERRLRDPTAVAPVYIIGSEVPIPGGAMEQEDGLSVTPPGRFRRTLETYREVFFSYGLDEVWQRVIAVVVQPGVEFGDDEVFAYDSEKAKALIAERRKEYSPFFEGHSTDYQSEECLAAMVRDDILILKVGPALTNAYREAVFALAKVEEQLIAPQHRSYVCNIWEEEMLKAPGNWVAHYHGTEHELTLARRYSLSDRSRYYLNDTVQRAIDRMVENLRGIRLPIGLMHQYLPLQTDRYLAGTLPLDPEHFMEAAVVEVSERYYRACEARTHT